MTLYAVIVERSQSVTIWVHGELHEDAVADAEHLAADIDDWNTDTTQVRVRPSNVVPRGHRVWSGGEHGEWVDP